MGNSGCTHAQRRYGNYGKSLIDFNSFPMRICALPTATPWKEGDIQPAELRVNHLDALYKKSMGCQTPSGWSCEHLPYLVEIDNYGKEEPVNVADTTSYFPWGWDEISWFAKQPEKYRNEWLQYVWQWMKKTDPDGHIEMPGIRGICCPNKTGNTIGPIPEVHNLLTDITRKKP